MLCDAFVVHDDGSDVGVITDPRFENAIGRVRTRYLAGTAFDTEEHTAQFRAAAQEKQRLTNTEAGYWIAAATPAAAHHAVTGTLPLTTRRMALLTDGASCAVDVFGLFCWPELLDLISEEGPGEPIRRVRKAEHEDKTGTGRPKFKTRRRNRSPLYVWRNRMTDQPRHSVSVAAVVTEDQDRVLVIKRRDNGAWQLPGGVLELDERIEDGVVREVLEETNVVVRPTHLTGVYKNMKLGVVALVMSAEVVDGQPEPTDESSEVDWWPSERVKAEMSKAFGIRILDALADAGHPRIRHHDGEQLL